LLQKVRDAETLGIGWNFEEFAAEDYVMALELHATASMASADFFLARKLKAAWVFQLRYDLWKFAQQRYFDQSKVEKFVKAWLDNLAVNDFGWFIKTRRELQAQVRVAEKEGYAFFAPLEELVHGVSQDGQAEVQDKLLSEIIENRESCVANGLREEEIIQLMKLLFFRKIYTRYDEQTGVEVLGEVYKEVYRRRVFSCIVEKIPSNHRIAFTKGALSLCRAVKDRTGQIHQVWQTRETFQQAVVHSVHLNFGIEELLENTWFNISDLVSWEGMMVENCSLTPGSDWLEAQVKEEQEFYESLKVLLGEDPQEF